MKTLPSMRLRAPRAPVPKIWIWTAKIMPDLWLSADFCQIKKKSLHPNTHYTVQPSRLIYNLKLLDLSVGLLLLLYLQWNILNISF